MTDFPTRILLATDGSEDAAFATRTALNLANKTGSELHVVYVEEVPRRLSYSKSPSLEEMIDPEFEEQMRKHAQADPRFGRPYAEIVYLAEELEAGMVVVGSRGEGGVRRALLGSVSDSVVHHAHCPVLVVRK